MTIKREIVSRLLPVHSAAIKSWKQARNAIAATTTTNATKIVVIQEFLARRTGRETLLDVGENLELNAGIFAPYIFSVKCIECLL